MTRTFSPRDFSIALALLGICGFFAVVEPKFLDSRNLSLLMTELSITATLAMGMLLVILSGHIDLSVGSGLALLSGIATVLTAKAGFPAPLSLFIGLTAGLLIWWGKGWLIVKERIPAFIVTLAGLLVFRGLFWLVIQNQTVPVVPGGQSNLYSLISTFYLPPLMGYALITVIIATLVLATLKTRRQRLSHGFEAESGESTFLRVFIAAQALVLFVVVTNQFRGIPLPAVIFGVVATSVYLLTQHTAFGRYLYAIGGNPEAALVSGIPVGRVVIGAFALMGGIVAITGFMLTSYTGNSTTDIGEWMELDAVAACVIGGVSLRGGRGTVLGVLAGALIMATLLNGMTLMSVSPEYKLVVRGSVLLLAVWMDVRLSRQS
ncbi:sugar ABC transporter permease [Prosthecobacter dejongeii]|uniref:Xylose transport system permease protein XylH n=1 Tax=Prosthecobacter dejongeii TaxID=48465 RepID=A0A7W7YND7_9BACT|nr:ATPase [Prosthecobacter dejongeii]MBB5039247.1 D-xylose transport system permease protein [Prosthecobacter dejongeii]